MITRLIRSLLNIPCLDIGAQTLMNDQNIRKIANKVSTFLKYQRLHFETNMRRLETKMMKRLGRVVHGLMYREGARPLPITTCAIVFLTVMCFTMVTTVVFAFLPRVIIIWPKIPII